MSGTRDVKYFLTEVKKKNRGMKNQIKEDFEIIFHIVTGGTEVLRYMINELQKYCSNKGNRKSFLEN